MTSAWELELWLDDRRGPGWETARELDLDDELELERLAGVRAPAEVLERAPMRASSFNSR